METINHVVEQFLADQSSRLKQTSLGTYCNVMELFVSYMNSYAYQYLGEERGLFEEKYRDGTEFCEIFGANKITDTIMGEFLSYFMIRKVAASKGFMKSTGTVMRRFATWLNDSSYIDHQKFRSLREAVDEIKDDLPLVVGLTELLQAEVDRNSLRHFEDYTEGYFLISRVEESQLWLTDHIDSDLEIGPVVVSKKISSLAKVGWVVFLVLGRGQEKWFVTDSGNVYPH